MKLAFDRHRAYNLRASVVNLRTWFDPSFQSTIFDSYYQKRDLFYAHRVETSKIPRTFWNILQNFQLNWSKNLEIPRASRLLKSLIKLVVACASTTHNKSKYFRILPFKTLKKLFICITLVHNHYCQFKKKKKKQKKNTTCSFQKFFYQSLFLSQWTVSWTSIARRVSNTLQFYKAVIIVDKSWVFSFQVESAGKPKAASRAAWSRATRKVQNPTRLAENRVHVMLQAVLASIQFEFWQIKTGQFKWYLR